MSVEHRYYAIRAGRSNEGRRAVRAKGRIVAQRRLIFPSLICMSTFRRILAAILLAGAAAASAAAQSPILPVDQVKAGMKGKGRTVFEGSLIEEFDADILGVLTNNAPKRSVIIARLRGKVLETAGVIAGMSGSPVYVDGRMIGAVAFSFPYAKEAIAGITPIGEMMAIPTDKGPAPEARSAPEVPFTASLSLGRLLEIHKDVLSAPDGFSAEGQTLVPLKIPLMFGGFSSRAMDAAAPFFSRMGFQPVKGGGGGQAAETTLVPDLTLREGDPVTVQLVDGDLDLSAVGTVTYVDGNNILAFGHPLYNLGPVDYGMAKAKIITVVPTLDNSFKLAATGAPVGAFTQDRASGARGELGRAPKFVPLNIRMLGAGGAVREFKLKLANDKILTPVLVNMSLLTLLGVEVRAVDDLTLEMQSDIYLDNGADIKLENMFSGNFDAAVQDVAGLMTAAVFFLTGNEFKAVAIHRIDLSLRASELPKFGSLERVWLDAYEAAPGETINAKVYVRTFRGETLTEEVPLTVPSLPAGTEFELVIGDAAAMQAVEVGQYRATGVVPRNIDQVVRLLSNLRKNNRIYFKIIAPKPGLFLRGEELPNLPPAMKSLFASPRAASSSPTEITMSTLGEFQLPVPFLFKGSAVIPIRIRK